MEYNVAVQMKIYIDEPANIPKVRESLRAVAKVSTINEQDVAFGIKVLKVVFLLNDKEGGMTELEEKVGKVPHVSQYEIDEVGRIG
ncbi:MAG: hypothetical protein V1492_02960 [Candidatus Micrarchaeota archaeon]